jgi:hypothetical protein
MKADSLSGIMNSPRKMIIVILAALSASLVVSAPILRATDLRGTVVGLTGPLYGAGVALFEVKPNMKLQRIGDTVTAPDGKYYFNNVHPGQYVLRVRGIDYTLEVRETQMQDIPVLAPNHVWRNQAGGASGPR